MVYLRLKMITIKKSFFNHLFIILFLFLYLIIISQKIISTPLPFYDWDEAIYAEVGREMIERRSIIPLWQGKYWLDKPPLVMLIYGSVSKILSFLKPEISTRLFNLSFNLIFLILLYQFSLKLLKSKTASFFVIILTSFTPLFIQRVYTINMDVFLALGWLGYFYFYPNFLLSTIFLSLAFFSKSLLGFYPLLIVFLIQTFFYLQGKVKKKDLIGNYQKFFYQFLIFSIWYFWMFFLFKKDFISQHIYESHFKRITASIEFHFGEKIFYFLEIYRQFSYFIFLSVIGLVLLIYSWLKKKIKTKTFFQLNLFLPWFLFLNFTKTKIFWYVYPVIPQFGLYFGFLIEIIEKKIINKSLKTLFLLVTTFSIFYWGLVKNNFLGVSFSSKDKYYHLANFAKKICQKIYFLPEKSHRQAIAELEKMNLTITTTKWWGGHPALVYYTDNKIVFIYDKNQFLKLFEKRKQRECFSFFKDDIALNQDKFRVKLIKNFGDVLLIK